MKWTKEHRRKWLVSATVLLVVLVICGSVLAGCTGLRSIPRGWSGATAAGDNLVIGSMAGELVAVDMATGTRQWDAVLQSPVAPPSLGCAPAESSAVAIYGSPTVVDNIVYVGGYSGIVYAYKLDREEPAWLYPRQGTLDSAIIGSLVVSQDSIYFGCGDGKVYALDIEAEGLFKKWEFETGDMIWSTPAIDGDTLFIVSFDKKLYAIDTETGKARWEQPFQTEGVMVAPPVVHDNTVFVGSFDRYLYAVDTADGSLKWKFMAENWFWAKPIIHNDAIYAPCLDGRVYVLDVDSGDDMGTIDLENAVSSSPVLEDDLFIVATEDGVVYGIDTATNQVKWRNDGLQEWNHKIYGALGIGEGKVFIHSNRGELRALDVDSGFEQWSFPLSN